MLGEVIKWSLIGAGAALAAAASWWMLSYWDRLLLYVLAPWKRQHNYQGVLNFLVEVDENIGALRRIVLRFMGRKGEKLLSSPVFVTEQIVREQDLPPELRRPGTHALSFDMDGLKHG